MHVCTMQDFHHETPQDLVNKIGELLDSYMPNAKAKYLGIVCKVRGGSVQLGVESVSNLLHVMQCTGTPILEL